ncbi:vWA domain-containing protein [Haloarchaeobius sp. DT45]|uniref:vWA domain-containing protein n=1 Tax=Haloarchaeobius sp. DT45 TaxID=3446116 RepID=UPI003F6D3E7B
MTSPPPTTHEPRGVSPIVGLVVLMGLVAIASGLILLNAASITDSVQEQSEIRSAELTLEEASARLRTLSFKNVGDVSSIDLSGKNTQTASIRDDGTLSFRINGHAECEATMDLGSVIYENDEGESVAYQAGGVWRNTSSGSVMVSSPGLRYRVSSHETRPIRSLDFPVVNVEGNIDSDGEVNARKTTNESERLALERDLCLPVSENDTIDRVRTITVTVENSSYSEAWNRYMGSEFDGYIIDHDYYPSNGTVSYTIPLGQAIYPGEFVVEDAEVRAALWGTGTTDIVFESSPAPVGSETLVDSYDSDVAPHPVQSGSEALVVNDGSITVRQSVEIRGDVAVDGDVTVQGNAADPTLIDGNVSYNGTNSTPANPMQYEVTGSWYSGFDYDDNALAPIDEEVVFTVDSAALSNHNAETPVFNASFTDSVRQSGTVESGVYLADNFDVDASETVTFDTSGGDVVVAVNESANVQGRIEVEGEGQVRLFVMDDVTVGGSVKAFGTGSTPTNDSTQFWAFARGGADVTFEPGSRYTGVVYAPGPSGTATLEANWPGDHAEVFGAIVGGETAIQKGAQLHFDENVRTGNLDSDGDGIPDSADPDDDVADGDADGVPDYYDDCPDGASGATGDNGCAGVDEDESKNALVVNQSRARINVIGSVVADIEEKTVEVGEREPLDVVFVIDDSGSMGSPEVNKLHYGDYEATGSYGPWSEWESPENASYVHPEDHKWGFDTVPSGQQWEVRYLQPQYMHPDQEVLGPGRQADFRKDNGGDRDAVEEVRRRTDSVSKTYQVNEGEVWLVSTEPDPDEWEIDDPGYDTKWFYPGETFSSSNWNYYERYSYGNDPDDEREDAMRSFIGMLNASKGDAVGVVSFTTSNHPDAEVRHDINTHGSDFDGANTSLNLQSSGGTPMEDAIQRAEQELAQGDNDKKVMVFLTDGRPDGDEDDVLQAAADLPDNIEIQTVGLGGNTDEDLLQKMADATDGNFSQVGDSENLNETFRQIAGDVTEEKVKLIEHKNTSLSLNFGGQSVELDNVSVETDGTDTIESADIDAIDVGDYFSVAATSHNCENTTESWKNVTHDGEEYGHVTCDGINGTNPDYQSQSNTSDTYHETYVDGETVPPSSEFTAGWYKDSSTPFRDVIANYESQTGLDLIDESTGTFDLGENDAIIVVRLNHDSEDTDFVVLHFDAYDTTVTYPDPPGSPGDSDDDTTTNSSDDNSYVVDVDQDTIEVGDNATNRVALGLDAPPQPADAQRSAIQPAGPTLTLQADLRTRAAV